jgi:heparinase II/III-like protein
VYPNMNYEQQSDFGQMMATQGTRYTGKIANLIWESYFVAPELSEAYDNIWETIDTDAALKAFYHQTGEQIRACIEANYLEEAIDAYFADKMRGNYGTHQAALLQLAVVRQHGDNARYVAEILHRPEGHMLRIGIDYGLYNLVYRDGNPHESPGYNFVWTRVFSRSADLLGLLGYDFPDLPRLKRMFDAPLDFIAIGKHSPALGDTSTRYAPLLSADAATYRRGLELFGDPRYAAFLTNIGAAGTSSFSDYDALFTPPLAATALRSDGRAVPPQPSRVFSGYGYALLNNPADTRAVGIFYGLHVAHYHHDRLSFDLFANGQAMTPSLGYPDGANEFNPGIFTWSKATVSHNTVTVDARQQQANPAGRLLLFADGPFARALVADAPGTYPQASVYRRTLVMVDAPRAAGAKDEGYIVDFFDVAGGREHDYSLHGPTGEFKALGGTWSSPEPGTLAGPDVALGALYDDPLRGAPGFKGSYLDYTGSGFQHLTHVQRLTSGADTFVAEYIHDQDPNSRIRLRVLPQPGQELILADARVSPLKFPDRVKFLIARRVAQSRRDLQFASEASRFTSHFVAVLEPFTTAPFIATVHREDNPAGSTITITRTNGDRDMVMLNNSALKVERVAPNPLFDSDAQIAVVTYNPAGQPIRAYFAGGTYLHAPGVALTAVPLEGTVTAVDVPGSRLRIRLPAGVKPAELGELTGRVLNLSNSLRQTVDTITAVQPDGDQVWLTLKDDLRVGLVHVHAIAGTHLSTGGLRIFGSYRGVTVCNQADQPLATVATAAEDSLTLAAPPAGKISPGEDLWLIDAAIGETIRLPGIATWPK